MARSGLNHHRDAVRFTASGTSPRACDLVDEDGRSTVDIQGTSEGLTALRGIRHDHVKVREQVANSRCMVRKDLSEEMNL